MESRELYDIIFRPLKIVVAMDMPLNENMLNAFMSKDATDDFIQIMKKLGGLKQIPLRLSSTQFMEEIFRIRHLRSQDYHRHNGRMNPQYS